MAEQSKADAIKHRRELTDIQSKVTNSYHCTSDTINAIQGIWKMFDQICSWYKQQYAPSLSPWVLATQVIYVEHRSNKGTADYKYYWSAQARFELPQQTRVKEIESHTFLANLRAPEKWSAAQMTLEERFALSIAGSCIHTAAKNRSCIQTTGPPTQIQRHGGRELEGGPLDSGNNNIPVSPIDLGP